ncbi:glycosyltransferase involved in cell wall biosynthesis [Halanaerobium saccharolyticum]|uniref:Glycosyltransferase involved in cell wall biosynthesis n=1 Tax=Halanaerobium saccharolyticum TaxID=43595 RepID=A0A4R7Z9X0_9FIRM|nr:glycosyltransferase [Halanaerobium saccharolyticum]RAK11940.1 glycosyltransferase involved in cell wall biosynthesis [Halanaerobium saccharolyticum]TDW07781.1 glycosyltransferase involved in cell wall biosynthesis [Halanaerobium saccharolyticum]TDX64702.1 glycosyltransferase involved in cell wall biosynthesis [Halanaerobium saccharolyticum]
MYIKYVFGEKWPSQSAGISFTTFANYGIAQANPQNDIELIVTGQRQQDEVLNNYFGLKPLNNFNIKYIKDKSILSKTTKFYWNTYNYLKNKAKNKELDVIITRKIGFFPFLLMLKKKYDIKIFYEAHNFYLDLSLKEEKHYKKKLYQKLFLPYFNGIICHHETLKDLYNNYLPNQKYIIARTGIKNIYNYKKTNYNLAYIGALGDRKNLKDMFKALSKIKNQKSKLIIIGGTNKEKIKKCKKIAENYNVEDRIEITGWINRKEIDDVLRNVMIGLVPLEDIFFNRYLTSPMKIFNYFSHGIPVIGTNIPTVKEILNNKYGLLYRPNDYIDLADKIDILMEDNKLYNNISKKIINDYSSMKWKDRGEKILNSIEIIGE